MADDDAAELREIDADRLESVVALPDDAHTDALLRIAGRALYAAKQRGRNRVEAASAAAAPPAATEPDAETVIDATLRASAADAAQASTR